MNDLRTAVSLNLNVRGLKQSATVAINELSNDLIAAGRTVYKLGLGQSPFPVPESVVEALRAHAHVKDYLEVCGLRALRQAVAGFHARHDGISATSDNVLVGPGSKELMFLLQNAYYGDLVIPTPCWVSYAPQAQIIGRRVTLLPTTYEDSWRLHPEALEELCAEDPGRPRIVILNYPGNPEGATYSPETLERIADVARRYGTILLSDEIYGLLDHRGTHISVARFYPEGTIISSGLSKWCGAGGWRLGTFTFPPSLRPLLDAMAVLASETFTSTSAPIQFAAIRAFDGGPDIDDYLHHARRVLSSLGGWAARRLRDTGARVVEPAGAFYLFPDFTFIAGRLASYGIRTSDELCRRALEETGVACLPGSAFGRGRSELTVRLAYVDFDGAAALAAAAREPAGEPLGEAFLRESCRPTVDAVERLCSWLDTLGSRPATGQAEAEPVGKRQ